MKVKLKLFFEWGITFGEPYTVADKGNRPVAYAGKKALVKSIRKSTHRLLEKKTNCLRSRRFPWISSTHGSIFRSLAKQYRQTPKFTPASPPGAKHLRERRKKMTDLKKLYQSDLPNRAISVYLYLRSRANKDAALDWPAIPTMARELKMSESTIRRALRDLVREGFLVIEGRLRENGADSSNKYCLIST